MSHDSMVDPEQFKVILLATDGSEFSAGVERVGIDMATQHGSQLIVLRLLMAEPGTDAAIVEEQDASLNVERIHTLCQEKGLKSSVLLRPAKDPSQGILAVAKEVGAQLLIIGRRGRRGMAKFMVGDATAKIIEKAECSVLVVPRLFSYWTNGVLLAVDPELAEGDEVAHGAFALAQKGGLPLTILTVAGDDASDRPEVNQTVNRLVAKAKMAQIDADGLVQDGVVNDAILEVARQRSCDIIVCEPRDRSMIDRLFNVNPLIHLIGKAHCPVLVMQGGAETA
ncbi:universal stress protein [Candidatus Magnetaquicoccus inordinatus]|uniref:universal stress protein n=1 Tax=Candidatus Magnetaquicoccus inordinatus TaxID=2496818 RepID=UPI00187D50AD|nr:universal stress protein [Candidatus Magnetaquicoccus inordinatus]